MKFVLSVEFCSRSELCLSVIVIHWVPYQILFLCPHWECYHIKHPGALGKQTIWIATIFLPWCLGSSTKYTVYGQALWMDISGAFPSNPAIVMMWLVSLRWPSPYTIPPDFEQWAVALELRILETQDKSHLGKSSGFSILQSLNIARE